MRRLKSERANPPTLRVGRWVFSDQRSAFGSKHPPRGHRSPRVDVDAGEVAGLGPVAVECAGHAASLAAVLCAPSSDFHWFSSSPPSSSQPRRCEPVRHLNARANRRLVRVHGVLILWFQVCFALYAKPPPAFPGATALRLAVAARRGVS